MAAVVENIIWSNSFKYGKYIISKLNQIKQIHKVKYITYCYMHFLLCTNLLSYFEWKHLVTGQQSESQMWLNVQSVAVSLWSASPQETVLLWKDVCRLTTCSAAAILSSWLPRGSPHPPPVPLLWDSSEIAAMLTAGSFLKRRVTALLALVVVWCGVTQWGFTAKSFMLVIMELTLNVKLLFANKKGWEEKERFNKSYKFGVFCQPEAGIKAAFGTLHTKTNDIFIPMEIRKKKQVKESQKPTIISFFTLSIHFLTKVKHRIAH